MQIKQLVENFGEELVVDSIKNKIFELEEFKNHFEIEADEIYRQYLQSDDIITIDIDPGHIFDFKAKDHYEISMQKNQTALRKINQKIKQYKIKLKIINGDFDESRHSLDLEAIKSLPCENFLPPHKLAGYNTLHFLAPWRDETKPSLVIYKQTNRFYDFGDPDKKGTVIDLIMLKEGLDFKQAIHYLKGYL